MITQQPKKFKVLLIGDNCIDEYQYGYVERISPEAPVPILRYSHTESKPGMVGNVEANLKNLNIDVRTIASEPSIKTRIVDIKSKQQLVRIDKDNISVPLSIQEIEILDLSVFDAIVISDYNKGFVSYENIRYLRKRYVGPIFLDTKKPDLSQFHGIYVKINELEYKSRLSINDKLIVTLGEKGAMYKRNNEEVHFPVPKIEVTDVCGAGDTFLSALAYKFLETKDMNIAINFANRASTHTVQHMGNYAPTLKELE
jgi:D-beta-D-heptose 7-phosphate kinase/D-beta-D-heptose 1-phosphate adenosyltransferase